MARTYTSSPNATTSQHATPATIALEGLCYAGKTTLAHAMADRLGVLVIPEYADLAPLPPFPPADHGEVRAALGHLLRVEAWRASLVRATRNPLVLLDRSPLSCVAFQYAVEALGVPCDYKRFTTHFTEAATVGRAILPTAYIYLSVGSDVVQQRQEHRGPVMPCLMDPHVLDRLAHAYRQFLNVLPAARRLMLDGSQSLPKLLDTTCAFATTAQHHLRGNTLTTWNRLPDLLSATGYVGLT